MRRSHFIDAIKGILILLVIIGHCIQYGNGYYYLDNELFYNDFMFRSIYSFHMPMFMIVSGYLFCFSNNKPLQVVMLSKLKTIGAPFVFFCSIIYFIWWFSNGLTKFYFSDFLMKMRYNMWFLSSVLMNCIIVGIVTHMFKKYSSLIISSLFLLLFFVSDSIISAPHKYMCFFFFVGYYLNKKSEYFSMMIEWMGKRYLFIFLTFLFVFIVFMYNDYMFIYKSGYCIIRGGVLNYSILLIDILRYIEALYCCFWFVFFMRLIKQFIQRRFFLLLGKYTLSIYGFQSIYFSLVYEKKCPMFDLFTFNIMPFVLFVGVLLLSLVSIWLCSNCKVLSMFLLGKYND